MDTDNKQPDSETDALNNVLEIIREITDKSTDGDYIYRGEPKCHENISSSLYREYRGVIESAQSALLNETKEFTIEGVQDVLLNEARKFTHETNSLEILTQIQHYGGKTNLIDFTTDCLIALFFACDGRTDETGRVIILKKTEAIKKQIEQPRNPINRILSQKSIFVRPPKGFIEPDDVVKIPATLKREILQYLKKHHGISAETIYNDLHGFIRIRKIHQSAFKEFYKALAYQISGNLNKAISHYTKAIELRPDFASACGNRGNAYSEQGKYDEAIRDYNKVIELKPDDAKAYNNRGSAYSYQGKRDKTMQDYNKAIELEPDYAKAYYNRGSAYSEQGKYDEAIKDYNKAIELEPDDALAYYNRGLAWLAFTEWEKAKSDLTTAKNMGIDIIAAFRDQYRSIADFEQRFNVRLPEDIATMLTPPPGQT